MNKKKSQTASIAEIKLLENELLTIKMSRSYKLAKAGSTIAKKLRKEPIRFPARIVKKIITEPKQIANLVKGKGVGRIVDFSLENRASVYAKWINQNEPDNNELNEQRIKSEKMKYKPLVSILTPVFNPPADVLEELIISVINQTYPYFELCLGDFGDNVDVKKMIEKYEAMDSRIRSYEFSENKGISGNSNDILEKCTGEYIGLLDHDDTLSPNALYENVKLLNTKNYDLIFSDKDMMDDNGNRYEPLFKPQLSHETMLSANYLTHFDVMRTSIVKEVGGWDGQTDGAQDWDLFLKIIQVSDKIIRIPKILYHWRVIATSTAHSIETKPYALSGQRRAVKKYLDNNNIKAEPYHIKTELLLKWDKDVIDNSPIVVIFSHSVSNTVKIVGRLKRALPRSSKVLVVHKDKLSEQSEMLLRHQGINYFYQYTDGTFSKTLNSVINDFDDISKSSSTVVFIDDRVILPNKFDYNSFVGWLSIDKVAVVGGKILDRQSKLVVDSGSIISENGIAPIFKECPAYHQSYLGNTEWVRNLKVVSIPLFAVKIKAFTDTAFNEKMDDSNTVVDLMIRMSYKNRLVVQPKTVAYVDFDPFDKINHASLKNTINKRLSKDTIPGVDDFSNPNVLQSNPMDINREKESPVVEGEIDQYQHDALILSRTFDLTGEQLSQNINQNIKTLNNPKSVGWFLPSFDGIYAGLNNIFSFAKYLTEEQGLKTYFFILKGDNNVISEKTLILRKFPELVNAEFIAIDGVNVNKIPNIDIGICTLWATAYTLAKCTNVSRKCYFIQDNETNFYPKGSISALVELTYSFNFFGIANTPGLLDMYNNNYGGRGAVLKSLVDLSVYSPNKKLNIEVNSPYKVFFYGRPNMPRNAFENGLAGLIEIKRRLGDRVQIVSAGADWNPSLYNVSDVLVNLGKVSYDELPEFYRSFDAGLMFMYSGHPGVIASELMASGVPMVVNEYEDITWNELYIDSETCLITRPTATIIADSIERVLFDQKLREKIISGGLAITKRYYIGYDVALKKTYEHIIKGS